MYTVTETICYRNNEIIIYLSLMDVIKAKYYFDIRWQVKVANDKFLSGI